MFMYLCSYTWCLFGCLVGELLDCLDLGLVGLSWLSGRARATIYLFIHTVIIYSCHACCDVVYMYIYVYLLFVLWLSPLTPVYVPIWLLCLFNVVMMLVRCCCIICVTHVVMMCTMCVVCCVCVVVCCACAYVCLCGFTSDQ